MRHLHLIIGALLLTASANLAAAQGRGDRTTERVLLGALLGYGVDRLTGGNGTTGAVIGGLGGAIYDQRDRDRDRYRDYRYDRYDRYYDDRYGYRDRRGHRDDLYYRRYDGYSSYYDEWDYGYRRRDDLRDYRPVYRRPIRRVVFVYDDCR